MTSAIRISSPRSTADFCRAFLFRHSSLRLTQLAKGLLCLLLLWPAQSWASFTILFNGVVSIVNTGSIVLNDPAAVVVDAAGNVYLADTVTAG
jgi:hypothetical protein